jgi:hypothetical protein
MLLWAGPVGPTETLSAREDVLALLEEVWAA